MADPATLGSIGISGSAAGGGLGIISSIFGGNAKRDELNYQAGVAEINAQIAQQNADYAMQAGGQQSVALGIKQAQGQARIRNTQAASGLDVNSGSNKDVQDSQRIVDQMDADTLRANTARTAYGYKVQETGFKNSATLARMGAENAETAGYLGAATSFVSATSSVADKWSKGLQSGMYRA